MISKCLRLVERDKGLTFAEWRKFFEANPTPWVYKAHDSSSTDTINTAMNAKAYITNVEYFDDHFAYDLHLLDGFTVDDHLEHTIEPTYGILFRGGKAVGAAIKCLEFCI